MSLREDGRKPQFGQVRVPRLVVLPERDQPDVAALADVPTGYASHPESHLPVMRRLITATAVGWA